jgi:hypothetical protein
VEDLIMSVKSFLKCITPYENVCVEDENFNVFASGCASDVIMDKAIRGLKIVECHTGCREFDHNRRSSMCLVIIAKKD